MGIRGGIALVQHGDDRCALHPQLLQQPFGHGTLFQQLRAGDIADAENEIGTGRLLQRGMEGLHQLVGQPPHQTYGINEHDLSSVRQLQRPGSRVQRGKELILRQHPGLGQGVQQGGFPHIGVAHNGHRGHAVFFTAGSSLFPAACQGGQFGF